MSTTKKQKGSKDARADKPEKAEKSAMKAEPISAAPRAAAFALPEPPIDKDGLSADSLVAIAAATLAAAFTVIYIISG
jgi:hypothetical protein